MAKKKVKKQCLRWTTGEEDIVLEEIGKNPTNLSSCFFMASEIIGRSPAAISNHYYTKMVNDPDVVALLTIGRTSFVKNRKRLKPDEKPVTIFKSIWNTIIKLLFK